MKQPLGVLMVLLNKDTFCSSEISSLGADIAVVNHTITPSGPMNALGNGFFGAIGTHNADISGAFV
jgi:hypothetical protein